MKRANLMALALVGCAPSDSSDGRSDVIPLYFPRGAPDPATLDEIESTFGMEIRLRDEGLGSITAYLFDAPHDGLHGASAGGHVCSTSLWSTHDPRVMAHEIAHALALGHVSEPDNLMHPHVSGDALDGTQLDTARASAWIYQECERVGDVGWGGPR